MSLPIDWPTLQQPAPTNLPADQRAVRLLAGGDSIKAWKPDGTVADAATADGPLRAHAGPLLADAAIARAELGREQYGSYVTRDNGRSHAVDALQELADCCAYLAAWWDELPADSEAKRCVEHALARLRYAAEFIEKAVHEKEQPHD